MQYTKNPGILMFNEEHFTSGSTEFVCRTANELHCTGGSLWACWRIVGARFLPGLSCPCLVWKRCRSGVGKSYKVTACCWGFVRALAVLCCGYPLWKDCQTQHQHKGRKNRAIFHLAGVISVCTALCCASECCLGMCKLWGETGVNRPGSVLE